MTRVASAVLIFPAMSSLKIARFAHLPAIVGVTWKWLALLAAAGVVAGLALALMKSLPVS